MAAEETPRTKESGAATGILRKNLAKVTATAMGLAVPKPKSKPAVELADEEQTDDDLIL